MEAFVRLKAAGIVTAYCRMAIVEKKNAVLSGRNTTFQIYASGDNCIYSDQKNKNKLVFLIYLALLAGICQDLVY